MSDQCLTSVLGLGNWGMALLSVLAPETRIVGVERDPRWVDQRATELGVADRCRYALGVAEPLEFDDEMFDLVTCQTLLITSQMSQACSVRCAAYCGLVAC